jgi:hypothetical protein
MTTAPKTQKPRPIHTERIGSISASIWPNTTTAGRTFYSTTIERMYWDGDELKNTDSFNYDDLLNVAKVSERAGCEYSSGAGFQWARPHPALTLRVPRRLASLDRAHPAAGPVPATWPENRAGAGACGRRWRSRWSRLGSPAAASLR